MPYRGLCVMRCAPLEIVVPRGPATAYIHVNMHVSIAIPTRDKNSQHQARGNNYEGGGTVMSSPSGIPGQRPIENEFGVFYACQEAAGSKDSAYFIA